jgi:hypothetical protein
MIRAEKNVTDPLDNECAHDEPASLRGGNLDPGLRRVDDNGPASSVEQLDSHQHVGDAVLQPKEVDTFPGQACGSSKLRAFVK